MLVNWNLKDSLGLPDNFPVLTGDYSDFTIEWYNRIGMTMVSNIGNMLIIFLVCFYVDETGYRIDNKDTLFDYQILW